MTHEKISAGIFGSHVQKRSIGITTFDRYVPKIWIGTMTFDRCTNVFCGNYCPLYLLLFFYRHRYGSTTSQSCGTLFLGARDYFGHSLCHGKFKESDSDRDRISLVRIGLQAEFQVTQPPLAHIARGNWVRGVPRCNTVTKIITDRHVPTPSYYLCFIIYDLLVT